MRFSQGGPGVETIKEYSDSAVLDHPLDTWLVDSEDLSKLPDVFRRLPEGWLQLLRILQTQK